jgi:hypothetical protein
MKSSLKPFAQIGAGLAFLSFLLGGLLILKAVLGRPFEDSVILAAVGLYFIGNAFYVGTRLWLATEKVCAAADGQHSPAPTGPARFWPWRAVITITCGTVVAILMIYLVRATLASGAQRGTATPVGFNHQPSSRP